MKKEVDFWKAGLIGALIGIVIVIIAQMCFGAEPEYFYRSERELGGRIEIKVVCPTCGGSGAIINWDSIKTVMLRDTPEDEREHIECPLCKGFGWKWTGWRWEENAERLKSE